MRAPALAIIGALALFGACSQGGGGGPAPVESPLRAGAGAPDAGASLTSQEQAAPPAESGVPGQAANLIPPPPEHPLQVGSQDAREDMYCSALIYAENPDVSDALAPVDEALLRKAQALGFIIGESGINKLVAQKAIHATHARILADAYAAEVEKDLRAKKLRLSLEACNKRAEAIPAAE